MKLSKKVIIYFAISSVFIFILGSITAYFVLKALIAEEVDETLVSEKKRIVKQLEHNTDTIPNWTTINMEIQRIPANFKGKETLNDTLIYAKDTKELIPLRQIHFYTSIKNRNYRITLRRSLIEKEDLIAGVTALMIGIFVATILLLNLINIWSDRKLWSPFYKALNKLNAFELESNKPLNLPQASIKEFNQLNETLNAMADKLQQDYRNLKEFSENAAHEMQTPLAILRSKLDILIQDQTFSEAQLQNIRSLYNALNRLARLNQSLNLLIKIENQQFKEKEKVDLCQLIEKQLENLSELIQIQRLKVTTRFNSTLQLNFNPFMAETLISNLLINAIKHNLPNGFIEIKTTENSLTITNSGPNLQSDPQELFVRFKKDRPAPDSPGLGLSIVQSICRQNALAITYQYKQMKHTVVIKKTATENRD